MNKEIWTLLEDNEKDKVLVELVQEHCKLALEFIHRNTSLERKAAIKGEIAILKEVFKQTINRGTEHTKSSSPKASGIHDVALQNTKINQC